WVRISRRLEVQFLRVGGARCGPRTFDLAAAPVWPGRLRYLAAAIHQFLSLEWSTLTNSASLRESRVLVGHEVSKEGVDMIRRFDYPTMPLSIGLLVILGLAVFLTDPALADTSRINKGAL